MKEMRTNRGDDNLEKYGSYIAPNEKMNEKFYKTVMDEVDAIKENAFLPLEIYNSLNKKVLYDEIFAVFEQDQSLDFIKDIMNKKTEEITLDKNNIICATWADAFAYMLTKNGYEAVVDKAVNHSQVFFKAENHIFRADATGKLIGYGEENQMSDLTRSKLGIIPQGFLIYEENSKGNMEERNFFQSDFYKNNNILYQEREIKDYTLAILEELKQEEDFYSYEIPKDYENVFSQLALISEMLNKSTLDTVGGITYLKHLMKVLIPDREQKKITLDHIKIHNEETDTLDIDDLSYGIILTYSPEKVEEPRYCYFHPSVSGYNFLYTKRSGLAPISEDEAYHLQERNDDIELKVGENDYKRGGK